MESSGFSGQVSQSYLLRNDANEQVSLRVSFNLPAIGRNDGSSTSFRTSERDFNSLKSTLREEKSVEERFGFSEQISLMPPSDFLRMPFGFCPDIVRDSFGIRSGLIREFYRVSSGVLRLFFDISSVLTEQLPKKCRRKGEELPNKGRRIPE